MSGIKIHQLQNSPATLTGQESQWQKVRKLDLMIENVPPENKNKNQILENKKRSATK